MRVAIASTRKFDQFGDWHFLGMLVKAPWYLLNRHAGDAFADRYWYRAGRGRSRPQHMKEQP